MHCVAIGFSSPSYSNAVSSRCGSGNVRLPAPPPAGLPSEAHMDAQPLKVGIVGLGRWAKVLTRAAGKSGALAIVAGYSRSEENRTAFQRETGVPSVPSLDAMLADPSIRGVILTVPNEQHLPIAAQVAAAGKHVYTEKPIASTLDDGLQIAALEQKYGVTVTVGHSARLMAGIQQIHEAIDLGELGRVAFLEANFSNERALELTPTTWRWYKDRAPGGPLSQLAIHSSTSCTTWAGRSPRRARWRRGSLRSEPKSTINR